MTDDAERIAEVAKGLTKIQCEAVIDCGDVADRFPCAFCKLCKGCVFSEHDKMVSAQAINEAGAIANRSGYDAIRQHLLEQGR